MQRKTACPDLLRATAGYARLSHHLPPQNKDKQYGLKACFHSPGRLWLFPMMPYPVMDPVIFSIGPLAVRWYGMMYLLGFTSAWLLGRRRLRSTPRFTRQEFDDLLAWGIFGVVLGARLGYVLFYDFPYYMRHPLDIFMIQHGGMSFHGGMLGVMLGMWHCGRRQKKGFFTVMDTMAPLVPPGLFFGRLGNFINAELWGRVTDVPWGMVFPDAGSIPRHPSQLYEAVLEGILLFCLLWTFSSKPRPEKAVSGLFLLGYGCLRFFVEFFREPDAHLGFVGFEIFSMGQLLCLPMVLIGIVLLRTAYAGTVFSAREPR
jgi:phosphatidylglycerol:prolipoprotein diacylglycerol transferase